MNLCMLNFNLKILLVIGGWIYGIVFFIVVVVDFINIVVFVVNMLEYLKIYKFDGLDFDWEYFGGNGSFLEDK